MTADMDMLNHAIACWNAGDLEGYLTLYDDGIKLHGYTPQPMTKTEVAGFYRQIWNSLPETGKPNPALVVLDAFETGDKITCRFVMSGTHSGEFMGVPKSGNDYVLPGITILKFSGGKAIERWSSADMLGLMMQIGAIPMPQAA
jgi:predicted ester cyclase